MTHEIMMIGQSAVIRCHGRIIAGHTNDLRDAVLAAINDKHSVILNLAEVPDVDSIGLGMLAFVCITARKRGLDVKLVAPSPQVQDVLETTMLGSVFQVHATNEEALGPRE